MKKQKLTKRILNRIIKEEKAKLSRRGILKEGSKEQNQALIDQAIEMEIEAIGDDDHDMIYDYLTDLIAEYMTPQMEAELERRVREDYNEPNPFENKRYKR